MSSFPAAEAVVPRLIVLASAGSTNDELAALAAAETLAPYTAVVTTDQTAGRGRRDRAWSTPPGRGLAISVLLPLPPVDAAAWLPLATGLAMRDALAPLVPGATAAVKWPNDVLLDGRKVCGVLGRLDAAGVVMGAGVNVRLEEAELPVPIATSLTIAGADDDGTLDDRVLAGYLARVRDLVEGLREHGPEASGLRAAVVAACDTIGREVRVELPDGGAILGRATGIGADARLAVQLADGRVEHVAAGDVVHLRATD